MIAQRKSTTAELLSVYNLLYANYGASGWWPSIYGGNFEIICGAILTQNTAWRNVEIALKEMRTRGFWSWRAIVEADSLELESAIKSSGYYRTKAAKLKKFAAVVANEYGYDLEQMFKLEKNRLRQKLLSIWGIGPETADDIILYAANKPSFVIDKYTMRLIDRLGLKVKGKNYHDYKEMFEKLLKPDLKLFQEYHGLIDIHVSRICRVKPICGKCCLSSICASAKI